MNKEASSTGPEKGIETLLATIKENYCKDGQDPKEDCTYKYVMERAAQYAEFTGKTVEEVVAAWENDRNYNLRNYYQDSNQPNITKAGKNVLLFDDWVAELKKRFGDDPKGWKFKCASCGNIQSVQDFLDAEIKEPESKVYFSCIGRYKGAKGGCDWTLGGLFQIHDTVVVKDMRIVPVFEMAEVEPEKVEA